jgi:predicted nucleic acid-binding protein
MQKTIISDTSCLILLDKIGELDLLHGLFKTLIITPEFDSKC